MRKLKERTGRPRVVIVAEDPPVQTVVSAMREGAFDVLEWPIRPEQLLDVVTPPEPREDSPHQPTARPERPVGSSDGWVTLLEKARRVSELSATVLIRGETGTGKDVLARYIASQGPRTEKPFVAVNCAALPDTLVESELFGHARGAFSGATDARRGLFEEADGGTIFLDEIGSMPLPAQAKLLRVLEDSQVRRVGLNRSVPVDVRVISSTNLDLEAAIARREFREDLYFRLAVVTLWVPALRDRRHDIPLLARHFLRTLAPPGEAEKTLSREALALLEGYPFPGNVRELRHAIAQAAALSPRSELIPEDFVFLRARGDFIPTSARRPFDGFGAAGEVTSEKLHEALRHAEGNRVEAARVLGVSRSTLYRLLRRLPPEGPEIFT